jgi:hypothetical protein
LESTVQIAIYLRATQTSITEPSIDGERLASYRTLSGQLNKCKCSTSIRPFGLGEKDRVVKRRPMAILVLAILAGTGSTVIGTHRADSVAIPNLSTCGGGGLNYAFIGQYWVQGGDDLRYGTGTDFNAKVFAERWKLPRRANGTNQSMSEALGEITVWFDPSLTKSGSASCANKQVRLNPSLAADPDDDELAKKFRGVLIHEFGHTLGLKHVGKTAAQEGGIPVMATCLSPTERKDAWIHTSDDHGAWRHKNDSGTGLDNPAPNPGFEHDGYAWGSFGLSSVSYTSSGTHSGNRRVSILAPNDTASFETAFMVSDSSDPVTEPSIRVQKVASDIGGTVEMRVYWRPVTFGTGSSCSYPSGRAENSVTNVGNTTLLTTGSVSPSASSWTLLTPYPAVVTPSSDAGIYVVRIYNHLIRNGVRQWARLDSMEFTVS